ncbi:hypothetical protein NDU88_007294 [Pleurodeles waltl]|uniref:Uncharacterized protein n=1 Tax=Pleurodeles waltl TaxID=8319 RepID=A0AAV7NSP2_PLEWA|nr:hypothetical protein NDU88_007294 [Pleurodeles waltl]
MHWTVREQSDKRLLLRSCLGPVVLLALAMSSKAYRTAGLMDLIYAPDIARAECQAAPAAVLPGHCSPPGPCCKFKSVMRSGVDGSDVCTG